jgi:hypothetical protein
VLRKDVTLLPIAPEALPLLRVAKGPQERELVEFLVEHGQEYPMHLQLLRELHVQSLKEVLNMRQLTPEQIGIDYEALLSLLGKERALRLLAQGEDREQLLAEFIRLVGPENAQKIFEQMKEKSDPNGEPKPST